jgi:hypothetical protein
MMAWAETAGGEVVTVDPADQDWPDTTVTWWVRVLPEFVCVVLPEETDRPEPPGRSASAVYLPLPSRDGEPGSTTTVLPVISPGRARIPVASPFGPPSLVRDPRSDRRALRLALPDHPSTVVQGWTARIHLPD